MIILAHAERPPEVLLVHAPYPGRLKFQGVPSSLFAAAGPFVVANPHRSVAYLDPRGPTDGFYEELRRLLAGGGVRAVCISTSTAAVEETAKIALLCSEASPDTLVVVGGPHEDAVEEKVANRVDGVHVSIGGEAESALKWLLERFLDSEQSASEFLRRLAPAVLQTHGIKGRFSLACCSWPVTCQIDGGESCHSDPRPLVCPASFPVFDVFPTASTIPLMVSRGCSYGRCTFCAESNRGGGVILTRSFEWVEELAGRAPQASLYFQDSIFPGGNATALELLPLLQRLGRRWGCQVYLPSLTRRRLEQLADHGCSYIYTGLESGAEQVLHGIRKAAVTRDVVLERMRWAHDAGLRVGLSLMFGTLSVSGQILETVDTIAATEELVLEVAATGVDVAGIYPNVQTVLPGTALARGLQRAGHELDFYRMPRAPIFDELEDGGIGYNFLTVARPSARRLDLAHRIVASAKVVQNLGSCCWNGQLGEPAAPSRVATQGAS